MNIWNPTIYSHQSHSAKDIEGQAVSLPKQEEFRTARNYFQPIQTDERPAYE